jgi:hypothetical protein
MYITLDYLHPDYPHWRLMTELLKQQVFDYSSHHDLTFAITSLLAICISKQLQKFSVDCVSSQTVENFYCTILLTITPHHCH